MIQPRRRARLLDRINWILPQIPVLTYRRLSFYRAVRARRFRLYNVGVGKSGTHSIAAVFARHHLAAHEPDALGTIGLVRHFHEGASVADIDAALLARDERLYLEVESSHLLNHFVPSLIRLFPEARFLLCLRDPWSWVRSLANQMLRTAWMPADTPWRFHRNLMYGPVSTAPEEAGLAANRISSIDGMMARYIETHRQLMGAIPGAQLLIIRTEEIGARLAEIAAHAGTSAHTLRREASHAYKSLQSSSPIDSLPPDYVDAIVERHCGDFAREWFPNSKPLAQRRAP